MLFDNCINFYQNNTPLKRQKGSRMRKPKLTKATFRSQRLRAKYVHDVIDYLVEKWDMNRVLNEPVKPIAANAEGK